MPTTTGPEYGIQDVWQHNLEEEFKKIRQVVQKYYFVAMVSAEYIIHRPPTEILPL